MTAPTEHPSVPNPQVTDAAGGIEAPEVEPPTIDGEPDPFAQPVAAPGGELAVAAPPAGDDPDADWTHERLDFMGDKLAVRKPTQQALAGFSLASSKYVSMETKNDITGLFIARHLSEHSYGQVFSRLMDPDDGEYTVETIGELMKSIVQLATGD